MEKSICCNSPRLWGSDFCSYCKEVSVFNDWEEAEKRINIIGQNGNDGLHYSEKLENLVVKLWEKIKVLKR